MDGEDKAPFWVRVLIGIVFFILATFCFAWFIYSAVGLIIALNTLPSVIEYYKSTMYLLGVSIGLFFMFAGIVLQGLLEKDLSKKTESLLARGMIAGVVIMFVLPQIVHYTVNKMIPMDRYIVCEEMSHQWMMHKYVVYTDNQATCDELVKEEEIRLSQPWF